MAEVAAQLPEGSVMQRWQVDAYADEPYCDNFRGAHLVLVPRLQRQSVPRTCICAQYRRGCTNTRCLMRHFLVQATRLPSSCMKPTILNACIQSQFVTRSIATALKWAMAITPRPCFHDVTEFRKRRGRRLQPQDPPKELPPLPVAVETGELPSAAEFEAAIAQATADRCCCTRALSD